MTARRSGTSPARAGDRPIAGCLALIAGLALVACGVRTRTLTPARGVDRTWRPSFVILVGLDRDAPATPPSTCRRMGVVEIEAPNYKVSITGELRAAARRIGGNTVVDIRRTSATRDRPVLYAGAVLRCAWFGVRSPSPQLVPSRHGLFLHRVRFHSFSAATE